MREIKFYVGLVALIAGFYGCQKPINLTATSTNANILVVEGLINVSDSTKIKLSRTVIIGNKNTANPEGGATISVENAQATVATLIEKVKGTYVTAVLNLDKTQKYRLRIKLANGKTYLSDLTETKVTPPIDSIGYNVINDGIQIYANAHDDTNNSRYYLYNFTDTWKFKAMYRSLLIWNMGGLRDRKEAEEIWECFGNGTSNNIVLNSTAALTQDVAYQAPIVFIGGGSEKISIRYTISVTQTALTKEAYVFWENLKKSTESLGSIFDAQPSQLVGNIHNVADADEPVIGYISAGTTHTKRIFIDKKELPSSFKTEYPFACAPLSSGPGWMFGPPNTQYVPLYVEPETGDIKYTDRKCGDCTLRGTLKQPGFWK